MKSGAKAKIRRWMLRGALALVCALALGALVWFRWVYVQIERCAVEDQAAKADAIGVFGAAEWDGRPSPVYRARLEHARTLYEHGVAPLIITMGGDGGDDFSEGGVGKAFLRGEGIPEEAIIAETESRSTADAARRIAVIARANGLKRLVLVSDPTHLFRIHAMCAAEGLDVLTSPRPHVASGGTQEVERIGHEVLSYTAWRLHLR
jgi:uncharacterized SAM-binding protein YcdF (DUF218 family)